MRSFVAGLAIFLAFLTGTAALGAFVAHQVVLDPDRAGVALDAALSDPDLQDRVLGQIVPGYSHLPAPLRAGVRRIALNSGVHQAAQRVTFDSRTGEISLKPLQAELATQLRQHGVGVAAAAVNSGDAVITVPAKDLKRYNDARDTTSRVMLLGGLATAVLVALALLVSPRRLTTLRSLGLTVLLSCVLVGAGFWILPAFIRAASSTVAAQAAAVVVSEARTTTLEYLLPFAIAGVVLVLAPLLRSRSQRPA